MSIITMDQIAVMSAQYVHYTFDYYLDSMKRCGIKDRKSTRLNSSH